MKNASITIRQELKQLSLFKEEVITLFVNGGEEHKPEANHTQIEIRQLENGKIEIFTDGKVDVKAFNEWYSL
jgi:hypothetical protein